AGPRGAIGWPAGLLPRIGSAGQNLENEQNAGRSATNPRRRRSDRQKPSGALAEAVIERVAGAAHGADRVGGAPAIESLAQPPDVHVDRTFVDVDVAAPDPVEQLLARKYAARALHQEFQETKLGRAERDLAAAARHALLLAIELDVAGGQHLGDALGPDPAQQRTDTRQ